MDALTSSDRVDPVSLEPVDQALIDRMWDFADPDVSAERFRAASEDGLRPTVERAVLATQLARALGLQGRFGEAFAVLDGIAGSFEPVQEAVDGPDAASVAPAGGGPVPAEVRARVAIERGRLHVADGRPADSVPDLTLAVREAAQAGSPFLVLDALHMLALHDAGHEEEWAAEGLDLLEGRRDPRTLRWGIALHHNLGWVKHDGGRTAAALVEFERAVEIADRYGSAEQQQVTRWSVGRCLRTLGRTDEALELQRSLAALRPDDPYVQAEIEALTAGEPTIEA
ncbi:tetratricopeptide repeat protein [Agromyces sp. CF514]|uniref:tetratricopeptide repeat protein n=1 Tax=Agromyces sp. CF514 TaxID=1881031 RepID=UPI0015A57536|nr:tetratricopeptide repeat protein [Agromyces sp. CF514]